MNIKSYFGRSKEQRYVDSVQKSLRELRADRIRAMHHLSVLQADLEANESRIRHLEACLPKMQIAADEVKGTL